MAEIYPFRALHYNAAAVRDLSKVVTQPYDKISPDMQTRYSEAHPANLVRIILRHRSDGAGNLYQEAARDFRTWIENETLIPEREPCLYPYSQEYEVPGRLGERRIRRGFIALLRLEDYLAGVVHRHEETLSGPKADRLELLKATRGNFGHIFMLYSDPQGEIEKLFGGETRAPTWQQVTDEYATTHRVWRISDPAVIEPVVEAMRGKKLVIADGHHRYETSLAYRDMRREEAPGDDRAEYVMATFVPMESEGLLILPTHRVVHSLPHFDWNQFSAEARRFFEWTELKAAGSAERWAGDLRAALEKSGREHPSFIAYGGEGRVALLALSRQADLPRWLSGLPEGLRRLDVVLLHRLLLENVLGIDRQAVREQKNLRYVRELESAVQEVDRRQAHISFLMNPTPIAAVWDNALAGQALPQKSTDFYPKLLSGLTLFWMDNPLGL
jgi:uncharacterized protein (DUF1015 family)